MTKENRPQFNFRTDPAFAAVAREWCDAHGTVPGIVFQAAFHAFASKPHKERLELVKAYRRWAERGYPVGDLRD